MYGNGSVFKAFGLLIRRSGVQVLFLHLGCCIVADPALTNLTKLPDKPEY